MHTHATTGIDAAIARTLLLDMVAFPLGFLSAKLNSERCLYWVVVIEKMLTCVAPIATPVPATGTRPQGAIVNGSTSIEFPLTGAWTCLAPPGHHPFARDFMAVGPGLSRHSSATTLRRTLGRQAADEFYGWDRPVLAPFDAEVLRASDGWPDHTHISMLSTLVIWAHATFFWRPNVNGNEPDFRPKAGNFVMLKSSDGPVAFLAHLRCGSVRVQPGQHVAAGEVVGAVGNSGASTMPHLHINLFDQVHDLMKARVVPFVFRGYERRQSGSWIAESQTLPSKGELIRNQEANAFDARPSA